MCNKTHTLLTWELVHKSIGHLIEFELKDVHEISLDCCKEESK